MYLMRNHDVWIYVRCANSDPRIAFDRLYDLIDEAAGHGFLVRGTSFDHCSGNTLKDRIGLRTMLDAVENGRIEAVMVRDLEQISRNSYILVGVIEILRQNDVYLITTECDLNAELINSGLERFVGDRFTRASFGKPQNIMLLADGSIKMMDFGIARFSRAQSQTVSDKAIGSVHYISPEQAKGERTDARTDIYSVGVMLYEMLSGRLPFDGDGAVSIAIMQISEKPKPLAEIAPQTPAGLRQITEKAMEKDPDKRYQSAQEMLAAIEEFKRNPSIQFAYEYRSAEDNPERNINRVVSNTKPSPKSTSIHTGDARRVGTSNPGRSKSAQKKKKKASKGFSLLPIFFGMAVAFVIGAAILIYLIFTNSSNLLFSNRADVQVISFVGMTKDEFLATDYNNLLRAEFPEEYSSEPAGTIIRQTPKAGRTVKEKQRIVLTVSLGTQYVTIPETKNMVAEDAAQTLKDMGLRVTKKPMSDNSVANGAVVYTQPAAGETVEGDSTVILYVSRSEVSKESQVPSLTGKTIEEARNEVKGLNLSIRTIEQASEQPAGTVLSQSPDAGSTVRKSSVITLVVSTGVPEVVATPEPVEPTVNEDGSITVQESWWPSADGSHQIHQLTDGTMWNENGQRCDAQGNPIA